jgi:hypothetical protein
MATPADKVTYLLKHAKSPSDVLAAFAQDPLLVVGIVVLLAIVYLLGRIYIWPTINPFQVQWRSRWNWLWEPSPPTPQERYPYAKVIYST